MRRPAEYSQGFRWEDIKKNLSEPQLAAYGACLLAYNECEAAFDALFFRACSLPPPLWEEIARRIGSVDAKHELIKLAAIITLT